MKISWITDAGIRAETSQGLILFNHDENTLDESSQKDENTIAIFLNENLKKKSEKKLLSSTVSIFEPGEYEVNNIPIQSHAIRLNTENLDESVNIYSAITEGMTICYLNEISKITIPANITCGTTLTTKRITVDRDTGRVGINEESPDSLLHLTTNSSTSYSTASSDINQTNSLLRLENANGGDGSGVNNYVGVYFRVANGANSDATLHYVRSGDNTGTFRFKARNAGSTYNELMAIDSSGSVNKPKNPAFYAYLTTNNAVYTAGTTVPWDSTSIDTRSAFQTSGSDQGRYIIPTTGIYYFGWRLNRRNDSRFDLAIYVNGALKYIDEMRWEGTSGMWMAESSHYLISCTAGQKVDLRIYSVNSAGSGQFDGGGNGYYDAFFGWMVG